MDYKKYSAEDFALDQNFQKWVLNPDTESAGFWDQWLQQNPQQRSQVAKAIELVRAAGLSSDPQINEAYLSIWKHLDENVLKTKQIQSQPRFRFAKVAAVFFALALCSYLLWNQLSGGNLVEYHTAFGEVREFVLEDGSKVTLNSNSLLRFETGWEQADKREVFLEGEAFFEVAKMKDHKSFEVKTEEQVLVQVLGTEFNVSTRRQQVEVYLQSGKVKVNSLAGEATLAPGEFIVYQRGDQALVVKQNVVTESPDRLGWKDNFFVFNDTPLSEIVKTLEDDYGYKVTLQDKALSQRRITAKVSRKDVKVLLNVLSETLDVTITQEENRLTFTD